MYQIINFQKIFLPIRCYLSLSEFKILTQLQLNKVMGVCVPGVFTAHCKVKMTSQLIVCERSVAGGPVGLA